MKPRDLHQLKRGDKVGLMPAGHTSDARSWDILTVSHVTHSYIVLTDECRYHRSTGWSIGRRKHEAYRIISAENARRHNRHIEEDKSTAAFACIKRELLPELTIRHRQALRELLG